MRIGCSILALLLVLAGCRTGGSATTRATEQPPLLIDAGPIDPKDVRQDTQLVVWMDVWELLVPYGTISGNEHFWKDADEHAIDPVTYATLQSNGVRVGIAPYADWNYFKDIIAANPVSARKIQLTGPGRQVSQVDVGPELQTQTLFYYDRANKLVGRTFDRCQNLLAVDFQPLPRRMGYMRISLCPVVRSLRDRLEFTATHNETHMRFITPESLYDVGLVAELPVDSFLIVAPSPAAARANGIGGAFFIKQDLTERFERLLLLVPRPFRAQPAPQVASRAPRP